MNPRRRFLNHAGGLSAAGTLSMLGAALGTGMSRDAAAADYKTLVCVFLTGGNDGNDSLVPTDAAYNDYSRARPGLALPKDSLVPLSGLSLGHTFGMHPGLAPLAPLYAQGRLAWVVNAGPLVVPTTAQQVADHAVELPPFLLSHSDQVAMQQGWLGDSDPSGWGGRALESLPADLRHSLSAVTLDTQRTLVLGQRSRVSWLDGNGLQRYWGSADLLNPADTWTRAVQSLGRMQSANAYEAEYARTFDGSFADSIEVAQALSGAPAPAGNFPTGDLGNRLRTVAQLLPAWKAIGKRRQVVLINWGGFDTHVSQRGSAHWALDPQLATVGQALAAFDTANRASGMDSNVVTCVMTDFGRTLKPAAGGGTDHAWGNHWWVMGGPVIGAQAYGVFPTLKLGGPDDFDFKAGGRWVPTTSTDQFAATLVNWLGVPASALPTVFPNLVNFSKQSLGFLRV